MDAPTEPTPGRHPEHVPKRFGTRCLCGKDITQPSTGRTRRSCSTRCRQLRQVIVRKLRRREAWLRAWLQPGERDGLSAGELAREVEALLADIRELRAQLAIESAE